ncbi:MAG: response regulator [Ardenticatenaceae bacterium]|nr:response regulator [Anaerolineales bacterium]MCB8985765.1 response regulator [Ardenticatenaceae bacterium]
MTELTTKPYKVLVVDDDRIIRKILEIALDKEGYEVVTAVDGNDALQQVRIHHPDIVVTDKMMPEMDGFEFTRRLRRDPEFVHLPILVLTSQSELEDKLGAFEAGADDYLPKPFETAELAVRLTALLRRADALKLAKAGQLEISEPARLIVVHSLRGGTGCSSLAVNLSLALRGLWQKSTLLLDMVFTAGQVALMLNRTPKRTWADLSRYSSIELDLEAIKSIIGQHDSGLAYILGPSNPANAEKLDNEVITLAISHLRTKFDYIVADLPHRFDDMTLHMLDYADQIVLVVSPDLASIRAAAITLDTYRKLGYEEDKVKLVLNWTFEDGGLASKKIEEVLKHPISLVLPFAPRQFVYAINRGTPLLISNPADPVSALIEDFAFRLSKPGHQSKKPQQPSETWTRVHERLDAQSLPAQKTKERSRPSFWSF